MTAPADFRFIKTAMILCRCVYKNPLQILGRIHTRVIINHLTWQGITEPSLIHTGSRSKTLRSLAVIATHINKHQAQEGKPLQGSFLWN